MPGNHNKHINVVQIRTMKVRMRQKNKITYYNTLLPSIGYLKIININSEKRIGTKNFYSEQHNSVTSANGTIKSQHQFLASAKWHSLSIKQVRHIHPDTVCDKQQTEYIKAKHSFSIHFYTINIRMIADYYYFDVLFMFAFSSLHRWLIHLLARILSIPSKTHSLMLKRNINKYCGRNKQCDVRKATNKLCTHLWDICIQM